MPALISDIPNSFERYCSRGACARTQTGTAGALARGGPRRFAPAAAAAAAAAARRIRRGRRVRVGTVATDWQFVRATAPRPGRTHRRVDVREGEIGGGLGKLDRVDEEEVSRCVAELTQLLDECLRPPDAVAAVCLAQLSIRARLALSCRGWQRGGGVDRRQRRRGRRR